MTYDLALWARIAIFYNRMMTHGHTAAAISGLLFVAQGAGVDPEIFEAWIQRHHREELLDMWFKELEREDNEVIH